MLTITTGVPQGFVLEPHFLVTNMFDMTFASKLYTPNIYADNSILLTSVSSGLA